MITLHLFGKLAKKFGKEVKLDAKTPREAVIALSYQDPEYKEELRINDWHIFVGENNDITERELDLELGTRKEVYLVPVIRGANSATASIIVGAVLFVVGAVLSIGSFGILSPLGAPMMGAGIGLMVGGIIAKLSEPGESKPASDNSSFLFKGPTNSSDQGVAIPRGYGRCLVGSTVISAAVYAESI